MALRLVPLAVAVTICVATFAVRSGPPPVRLVPRSATGALSLVDSRGGGAILTASGMHPASSATGTVSILNASDVPAAVSLSDSQLASTAGLANWLTVSVDDLAAGRDVYVGPLSTMGSVDLGTFPARVSHDFRFTVTLRASAPNSVQNGTASVRYDWTATDASGNGTGPGTANPPPGGGGAGRADTHPPNLRLTGKWRQQLRPNPLIAYATCNEPCTLAPSVRVRGVRGVRSAPVTISTTRVVRGQRALIRVSLPKRAMRKMRKALHAARGRRLVQITLYVVATDRAGNQTGAQKTVVFRR